MKTKSKKAKAESANYLDYVPMHNEDKYPFQTDDNGAVTIMVENKGVFNKMLVHKLRYIIYRSCTIYIWPYEITHFIKMNL